MPLSPLHNSFCFVFCNDQNLAAMLFRKMCELALKEFQEGMCVVCFRRETSNTAVQQNIGRIWSAVYTTLAWGYWWWSHTQVGLCMPCLTITSSYLGLLVMITHPARSLHALPSAYPASTFWRLLVVITHPGRCLHALPSAYPASSYLGVTGDDHTPR